MLVIIVLLLLQVYLPPVRDRVVRLQRFNCRGSAIHIFTLLLALYAKPTSGNSYSILIHRGIEPARCTESSSSPNLGNSEFLVGNASFDPSTSTVGSPK